MFITIALPAESVNTCLSINLHLNSLLLTTWNRYFAWATFLPLLQSTHCNPVFLARLSASTWHWAQRECWKRVCYLQHLPRVGRGSGDGNFCSSLLPQAVTLKLWHLNREHKLFITSSTLQHWCLHYPGPYRRKTNHTKPNQSQPNKQMKKNNNQTNEGLQELQVQSYFLRQRTFSEKVMVPTKQPADKDFSPT